MIYKTIKIPIKTSKQNLQILFNTQRESAKVWNDCVDTAKKYLEKNSGKWISKIDLKKLLKNNNYNLLAKSVQLTVDKFCFARNAAKEASKTNKNIRYPHKKKKYFNTYWTYQDIKVSYNQGWITLAQNRIFVNGKHKLQRPIKCYSKNLPRNIVQVELLYQNGLKLNIVYKDETQYQQTNSNNIVAIDLGEIHSITAIDNNQNAIIITGRKLRSIKRFRNKKQAELQQKMSKCTKFSNQWWKYKRAWNYIRFKTQNQINDCLHKATKLFVDFAVLNNINTVYIGELEGIQRNTNGKKSKVINQKLTQMAFGEIIRILKYKLNQFGIDLVKVKEYYTSSTCPNCAEKNKPTGRNYKCKCDYKQHRDIVGAINILNFNTDTNIQNYNNLKYLQIA